MPNPYTIRHDSWAPDLQNVAVQVPYSFNAVPVPSADCLNVYYADGAFRCLPSLAPFAPSLGEDILNAFTWYDEVEGQEVVFAATANGFYELVNGEWSQIIPTNTVNINVQGTGVSALFTLGGRIQGVGISAAFTLGSGTVSGQLYTGTLVAGASGSETGYLSGSFGSLTPSKDTNGNLISALYGSVNVKSDTLTRVLTINTEDLGQDYFSTLVVSALSLTLDASAATYSTASGYSQWEWSSSAGTNFSSGTSYAVVLNVP